jgi:hypothetical protein
MNPLRLRHLLFAAYLVLTTSVFAFGQGSPLTLGPLTVNVPAGWVAQTNATPVRLLSPDSTPQQYFQVEFMPFEQITQGVRERHSTIVSNLSGILRPGSVPQNGVAGKFIWTRLEIQLAGQNKTMVLYSAKSGSTYIAIGVEATSPDIFAKNSPAVDAMVRTASLSDTAQPPAASAPPASGNPAGSQGTVGSMATIADYVFAMPPGWTGTQYSDALVLMSPRSATNEQCVVNLWPMRQTGANILVDADNAFRDVYKAFELRNMTVRQTPMPSSIVHGVSGQGWEYAMIRRGVAPRGSPESRLGFVFVARLNNRLAVISGVARDPLVSSCMGELVYNFWPRFFYSLSFKGWSAPDQSAAMRKKIAGVWTAATATAADQFTFAANGRYGGAAAASQYNRINSSEVVQTTQAYFGDGAYTLNGNAITLKPDGRSPETGFIRVEEESKDEGRTWSEALYLLRVSSVDGKDYELRYQKK